MAATFHPELSTDRRVHTLFVDLVRKSRAAGSPSQAAAAPALY